VKPLISLNSWVILPPESVTFFFAASRSEAVAPSLSVTFNSCQQSPHIRVLLYAYVVGRHFGEVAD
jgi:hypothetical protein